MLQKLFVANWKMNKSFAQESSFCTTHLEGLRKLSSEPHIELVICPSFPSLFSLSEILQDTMVGIGAQQCSPHEHGAYTGQVSAQSLQESGCTYCIVGHSEQRARGIPNQEIADQATRLFEHSIAPIICIGETEDEYKRNEVFAVLEKQLEPILPLLKQLPYAIAYEPVWAIGTGLVPSHDYLKSVYSWLDTHIKKTDSDASYHLLYGGSVDEKTIKDISSIGQIGGYLIGGASLDFKKLEKIVSLTT